MPFATKPDGEVNVYNVRYSPFIMECGFTETYSDVLADVISWLTQTDEAVRVVLLIKLIEKKTALIPPPLSIDSWIEDDNTPKEPFPADPAYEYLRESTMLDVWVGPLEGFAELWRLKPGGLVERDGDRVIVYPRPIGGVKKMRISKADIMGRYAVSGDELVPWDLDMDAYCHMLQNSIEKLAFQRRVRYLKATQEVDAPKHTQCLGAGTCM